ncbi:hypothetical protein HPB50_012535 [Hyalomma asiaticum]|uniref:Uncharacterized protein n=1 Tax=Hyalomma asiaticum TaxID=266040 RepID=A0ACB7SSC8_HYAAI|nr:hypothetical protein HPB50_012535 [Hyalomma asiaticum]
MRNVRISSLRNLLLFAALVPGDTLAATCRPEYQNLPSGLVHTACKPPNPDCNFVTTGLSAADKAEVLKAHNDLGSQVAQGRLPGFPTVRTSKFSKVGQNIAWNYESTNTPVVDSAGRVKDWFDEYKDFNPGNVDPFRVSPGGVVTHFTQPADRVMDRSSMSLGDIARRIWNIIYFLRLRDILCLMRTPAKDVPALHGDPGQEHIESL